MYTVAVCSPCLEMLPPEPAIRLLGQLAGTVGAAGWERDDQCTRTLSIADLRHGMRDPHEFDTPRWPLAHVYCGSAQAILSIK